MFEDKVTEIERENRVLLEKITHIMKNNALNPIHESLLS